MTENLDDPVGQSAADIARRAAIDAVRARLEEIRRRARRPPLESSTAGRIGTGCVGLEGKQPPPPRR